MEDEPKMKQPGPDMFQGTGGFPPPYYPGRVYNAGGPPLHPPGPLYPGYDENSALGILQQPPPKPGFWKKLRWWGQTIAVAAGAGAGNAAVVAVESGEFSKGRLAGAAAAGAITGVIGLWIRRPGDRSDTQP